MAEVRTAFVPAPVSSTIAVTASSQRVAFSAACNSMFLSNVGSKECFIRLGDNTITVAAGSLVTAPSDGGMSIPVGFNGVISTGHQSNLAAICAAGDTTTLRITPGEGR